MVVTPSGWFIRENRINMETLIYIYVLIYLSR